MKSIRRKVSTQKIKSNNIKIDPKFALKNYHALLHDFFHSVTSKGDRDRNFYTKNILVNPIIIDDQISYPKTIKTSIYNLIIYTRDKFKIPPDSVCEINLIYAMRCAKTEFKAPNPRTAARMIINYNNKDVYQMESSVSMQPGTNTNLGLEKRTLYMDIDTLTNMGPAPLCMYNTTVHGNPKFKIPTDSGKERITIKPRQYKRLTVVMDFYISKEFANEIQNHLNTLGDEKGPNRKSIIIVKDTLRSMIHEFID